jgi:pimeloyl-ACP methyl ester carboxylesterase
MTGLRLTWRGRVERRIGHSSKDERHVLSRSNGYEIARVRSVVAIAAAALVAASCGGGEDAQPDQQAAGSTSAATVGDSTTTMADDPLANPSVEGSYPVGDGRKLAIVCWGKGSPTVVLDAGSDDAGIARFRSSPMVEALAARTRVCTYDRAGLGMSDPAPDQKRNLDDAARDLHELLAAAEVPGPYLLVGSSGGGFNVYQHTGRYPDEVAGLVLLDVPKGQSNLAPEDVPAWDSPENPEHMDYVAIERQMALHRLPIPGIPVTVVTASAGQSADPKEQRVWLKGSTTPRQVVLDGGHVIYVDNPEGVIAELDRMLDTISSGG